MKATTELNSMIDRIASGIQNPRGLEALNELKDWIEQKLCPVCGEQMHCVECDKGACYQHTCDNPPI